MLNIFRQKSKLQQDRDRLKKYANRAPILKMSGWKVTGSETYGEPWFIRDFGSFQIYIVCYPMRHQYWVQASSCEALICESPPGERIAPKKVIEQARILALGMV
jgi:hypothetical protein